jgi:hypothetical protein
MSTTRASSSTFSRWLRSWPMPGQWADLVVLSSLVSLALGTAALPAALLLVMSLAPLLTRLVVRHSPHLRAAGAD